jgi:hypothetical protein
MAITVKKLREIILQYMHENSMNKKNFAEKFGFKYSTLLDVMKMKRKNVSDFIEMKLKDVIHEYENKSLLETGHTNKNFVNIINILPDEHKGFILYYLLKCLGMEKSSHVLNNAFSLLEEDKRATFEYQLYELARDILLNKEQELIPIIDEKEKNNLAKELKQLGLK